jgi:hypothetical protein
VAIAGVTDEVFVGGYVVASSLTTCLGDRGNAPTTTSIAAVPITAKSIAAASIVASIAAASIAAASIAAKSIAAASIAAKSIAAASIAANSIAAASIAAKSIAAAETNVRRLQDIVLEGHAELTVGRGKTRIRVELVCRPRCSVLKHFVLCPPVAMLRLSHEPILKSIANISRENHNCFLRSWVSRLSARVLFDLDPLEGKGDGVAMLLLKYHLAHAAAHAAVVATLPRPNNCLGLALSRTHHTLQAIATILLATTVNRVTEASMI